MPYAAIWVTLLKSSAHEVSAKLACVPVENLLAMYETVRDYGRYPLV